MEESNVKTIQKKFQKMDIYVILYILCVFLALIMEISNAIFKGFYSIFALPFLGYLLKNAVEIKQLNRGVDIDINFIEDPKQNDIIWKDSALSEMDRNSYLVIQNTGHIDIYEFFIKIKKIDGGVFLWRIEEHLLTNKKCIVKIPCDHKEIYEIVISGDLLTESTTKRFYGRKSSNCGKTIFSGIENFEKEKDSIIHEHDIKNFVSLERAYEKEM